MEQQLDHERLASLIDSLSDGVIAVDEHLCVVLYNGAALNVLDANTSPKGHALGRILKLFTIDGTPVNVDELVAGSKTPTTSRDYLLHYKDGSVANVYLSIAPVHLGYGEKGARGSVLLLRDITHEKSLDVERDEFISVVSHELRTPITIAEGNISNAQFVAEKTNVDPQILQALGVAHDQVTFLGELINDLSTLSRAEHGTLAVQPTTVRIPELLDALLHTNTRAATARGLVLTVDASKTAGTLHSGELYVREILQNLIANAIKYTQAGSVTITAKRAPGGVTFAVRDTGIGISRSDQTKVFEKFFRSEDYRTRKTSGTGLGLYVAQKLAHLLGASISVESKLNHGSTFTLFVPDVQ